MHRRRFFGFGGLAALLALLISLGAGNHWPPTPPSSAPTTSAPQTQAPTPPDPQPDPQPAPPSDPAPPSNPPLDPPAPPVDPAPVVPAVPAVPTEAAVPTTPPTTPPAPPPTEPTGPTTPPPAPPTPKTGPLTYVSLTFDDGNAGQSSAASILGGHGLPATFYVNSGTIGTPGKLTLAQLQEFAAAGNEIGGHSVTHVDLTSVPPDEVRRQVCDDRAQLAGWGFATRSFAYPFAEVSDTAAQIVLDCGYNSGRLLGDIRSRFGCADCDWAESLPPARPAITQALDQFDETWTLADLTGIVVAAEAHGGGWLQFTFHDVCSSSCGELGVSSAILESFATWLDDRDETRNTVVKTVGDVVGGPVKPVVSGPAVPPPSSGNGVINPDLETMQNGFPACWYRASWGDNDASYSLVAPGHSGSVASQVTIGAYGSGEGKIIPTLDLGSCAPSVAVGHRYTMSGWYTSTGVTQFAVYLRTTSGAWVYWTSSPWFAASSGWANASWTTEGIPAGYNGISFGLNIFSPGTLVTDDYSLIEADPPIAEGAAAPPPPPPAELPADTGPVEDPAPSVEPPAETVTSEVAPGEVAAPPAETAPPESS